MGRDRSGVGAADEGPSVGSPQGAQRGDGFIDPRPPLIEVDAGR